MGSRPWMITTIIITLFEIIFLLSDATRINADDKNELATWGKDIRRSASFDDNYQVTWGRDHILFLKRGREVQLSLDHASGSGFGSKSYFGSGFFQMRIKLPAKDTAGVVTAFYLNSDIVGVHDELDFEFLGNRAGKPITLQTNVFTNGVGGREQRTHLWFDPTADFHYYKLLWNQHQIVFFVDDIPIRIFKNNTMNGVGYPHMAMQVVASLWDGSNWATDGGKTKTNWSHAPFEARFQDFNIEGCPSVPTSPNKDCYSSRYWWNNRKFWELNNQQLKAYKIARRKYMNYDYCTDEGRYPIPPPECLEEDWF